MNRSKWYDCKAVKVNLHKLTVEYLQKTIDTFFYCLRCIYYHRSLTEFIKSQESEFHIQHIITTTNCYFDVAVIHWAKLFGSKNSEKTHFLHLLKYKELQESVANLGVANIEHLETQLFKYVGLDRNAFDTYKTESLIKYRDKYLSHNDLQIDLPLRLYPSFEIAEKALIWLYEFIANVIMSSESNIGVSNFAIYRIDTIKEEIKKEAYLLATSLIKNNK